MITKLAQALRTLAAHVRGHLTERRDLTWDLYTEANNALSRESAALADEREKRHAQAREYEELQRENERLRRELADERELNAQFGEQVRADQVKTGQLIRNRVSGALVSVYDVQIQGHHVVIYGRDACRCLVKRSTPIATWRPEPNTVRA